MELTENFVAAVRPQRFYMDRLTVHATRKSFELDRSTPAGRVSSSTSLDEAHMWAAAEDMLPGVAEMLSQSVSLVDRALGRRAEAVAAGGRASLAAMEERLTSTIVLMHNTVVEALDAHRITRAKPVPRRTKPSWSASMFAIASKVNLPYAADEFYMVVSAFPCALDPSAWTMRVRLAATSNEGLLESQRRIEVARQMLAGKGILIRDTTSGTGLVDL